MLFCATCFYVEVVILGDRFKYDEVGAWLKSVNDLFASRVLSEAFTVKKISCLISFNYHKMENICNNIYTETHTYIDLSEREAT